MTRQLMKHTQVMVNLSLNVITKTNDHEQLITLNLIRLTTLIFWLWTIWQVVIRQVQEVSALVGDLANALNFTGKVFVIGINSVAFGLGVSL